MDNNETTPLRPDSLLGEFTKPSESQISKTEHLVDICTSLLKIHHEITWHTMVCHDITWYYMVHNGALWHCIVNCGRPYIVYDNCMVYHGLSVSKHHDVLPWFPCFKTPRHTIVYMAYHGILPWFTCFKTTWSPTEGHILIKLYHIIPW